MLLPRFLKNQPIWIQKNKRPQIGYRSCCRQHKHQCADLRLHVAAWSVPTYHEELDVEVASGELRCLGDDLYRDYFEDVRQHVVRNTLQAGILGTRVEKLVANLASSMSGCPEVSVLGRLVVSERLCRSLLQNPLSPEALERQQVLRQDVEDIVPNLEANLHVGYLTLVPEIIVTHLLEGPCGKVIQAEAEQATFVLEPGYRWPSHLLGGKPMKDHGIPCQDGESIQVGETMQDAVGWDEVIFFFVDLDHPMPHDGRLSNLQFPFVTESQEIRLDVILLRPLADGSYVRRGTMVFAGDALKEELHVWRGDMLAFAGTGARMLYRNCSTCRVAGLPMLQSSHFQEVRSQHIVKLGDILPRAYSWSADLIPIRCQATSWHSSTASLPSRRIATAPKSSVASCSGTSWLRRSCRFRRMCYDVGNERFEFYGRNRGEDYMVGLSMFPDVRMSWQPHVLEAEDGLLASWIDVPVYLAMRHAGHNWGHHAVETILGLYALIMSNEDLGEVHGRRLIFFLDDCSLELQGDAIEFCMQFAPNPMKCIKEIPQLCAKFTKQLWPLLSDWAPLEKATLPLRAHNRILCFRSLVAGMAPWRRPVQVEDSEGNTLAQQEWAADPLFAPVTQSQPPIMADAVETPENRTGEPIAPQQEEAAPADPWAEEGQIEAEAPEALWEDEVSTPPQDTAVEATPEQGDDGSKVTPTEAPTGKGFRDILRFC
eukprot:symbB.v1.2.030734.t1/scaffold3495.1/size92607/4